MVEVTMKRFGIIGLLLIAAPVRAQEAKPSDAFVVPKGVRTIRLALAATPAPVPALKHRLLPELRDRHTGNSVVLYYRAFAPEWQLHRRTDVAKIFDSWSEDMRKVPPKDLAWVHRSEALRQLDQGARRTHCDWEMLDTLRREGIFMLLGDIQGFREYGRMLSARARLEMADGNLDKALYTLQTGFKLGRDVGDGPTLIQSLVGMALVSVFVTQTEELIQTPGSPNLYWALSDLPTPFISLHTPYQGEKIWLDNLFPEVREMLADKNARPLPEAQVRTLVDKLTKNWASIEGGSGANETVTRLGLGVMAARAYPEAKRFLLSQGRKKEDVESMSVLQAFLLLEMHNYDRVYDDMIKWINMPYPVARKGMAAAETTLKQAKAGGSVGTLMATLLLPAGFKVQEAMARTDRSIAALRVLEALRMHAASHDGKLPATLNDIKEVPIPLDPMTGNPFLYRLDKNGATLYAAPPTPAYGTHSAYVYELTLRDK
jgi:hypothetical protein